MIKLLLNGIEIELIENITLEDLIDQKNLKVDKIAVEINEIVVSKSSYRNILLVDGMKIEIITFVGGG